MDNKEIMKKIQIDLDARGLLPAGIVATDPATGNLQFIIYDQKGLVSSISRPDNTIALYGKDCSTTRAMHEIITISGVKMKQTEKSDA